MYHNSTSSNRDSIDYATIKYNSSGQKLWVARYKEAGSASALFVDSKGNLYVTRSCSLDSQYVLDRQYVTYDTIKYDPNGNEVWVAKYSKAYSTDMPIGLAIDTYGNVFITRAVSYFSPHTE